ncbi:GNAT family N-acetyltransferase [Lewinellaceae bacterium SD302]|nr:GNAT family N-acetyltransferase [Lewinellaceae bacterium SD302]
MDDNINIRSAVATDLPAIHGLVGELADYEKALPSFTATIQQYREEFAAGTFSAHVAETSEGEIIGMTLYYDTFSTWKGKMLYLEDFVVRRSYRGKGIGKALFDEFKAEAERRGCALIKWQVLDWNTPAVEFYERQGATIEKEWWNGKMFL